MTCFLRVLYSLVFQENNGVVWRRHVFWHLLLLLHSPFALLLSMTIESKLSGEGNVCLLFVCLQCELRAALKAASALAHSFTKA